MMPKSKKKIIFTEKELVTRVMLTLIGEDPDREGLKETPKRVAAAWDEWFAGYKIKPESLIKTFEEGGEYGQIVMVRNIPVMSHCEHHITPFIGYADVAYAVSSRVVGLSKLAKVVDAYSRRLQVQERLTNQIMKCLANSKIQPLHVGVKITAKHFCMCTRGANTPSADTVTTAFYSYKHSNDNNQHEKIVDSFKREFFELCKKD